MDWVFSMERDGPWDRMETVGSQLCGEVGSVQLQTGSIQMVNPR